MSLRLGFSVKSLTLGGVGDVGGVTVEGGVTVGGGVTVAGRFGHPTRKRARTNRGATRNTLPRRCDMFLDPPSLTTVYLALEPRSNRHRSARLSRQSYHGRRGDQEALVVSPGPRESCCCSDPSASMVKSWKLPSRLDWKTR